MLLSCSLIRWWTCFQSDTPLVNEFDSEAKAKQTEQNSCFDDSSNVSHTRFVPFSRRKILFELNGRLGSFGWQGWYLKKWDKTVELGFINLLNTTGGLSDVEHRTSKKKDKFHIIISSSWNK